MVGPQNRSRSHAAGKLDNCGMRPRSRSCCARLRRSWAMCSSAPRGLPSTRKPRSCGGKAVSPTQVRLPLGGRREMGWFVFRVSPPTFFPKCGFCRHESGWAMLRTSDPSGPGGLVTQMSSVGVELFLEGAERRREAEGKQGRHKRLALLTALGLLHGKDACSGTRRS